LKIHNIFSKRQKRLRGEVPDVYSYDKIPEGLRVQIIHILQDALGDHDSYHIPYLEVAKGWRFVVDTLCREYGLFSLRTGAGSPRHYLYELCEFITEEKDTERILDAVELAFHVVDKGTRTYNYLHRSTSDAERIADDSIAELNDRFREHGIGYQLSEGEIIRIDSELIHAEVVMPALHLLRGKRFAGAQQEFLNAHKHYRQKNTKESLADALKSIESVLKVICDGRGWKYSAGDTSKVLFDICYKNGLIPQFWQTHFSGLRSTLESGVPTARNKLGGHGQGQDIVEVPMHIASYVLHQTAAAIVFLVESDANLK
jgi:hypothetical protein